MNQNDVLRRRSKVKPTPLETSRKQESKTVFIIEIFAKKEVVIWTKILFIVFVSLILKQWVLSTVRFLSDSYDIGLCAWNLIIILTWRITASLLVR